MRSVRLAVLCLMFCFLTTVAAAQWPYVPAVQSEAKAANSASINCVFDRNVTSGNYGFMLMQWFNVNTAPTITDTLGSTYTQKLIDTSHTERVAVYTTTFGSSGANTVNMANTSGQFMSIVCIEMLPLWTLTVDASAVTTWSGSPGTITSPSITTTLNNDLIFVMAANDNSAGFQNMQAGDMGNWYQGGSVGGADGETVVWRVGGAAAAGNQITLDNSESLGTLISIAFKSNSLAVTTAAIAPDGATSNTYNWCALAAGGVGTYTWSVISGSLPTSLSLNSSTGCITGTPTVIGNYTATLQVSDGTNTASLATSFKITASLSTIGFVQGKSASTFFGNSSIAFTSSVTSGNLIIVDSSWNSVNNQIAECTDTLGTVFHTYVLYSYRTNASNNGGYTQISLGIAPSTGADTVACGGPSALTNDIGEFTNVNYLGMDNIIPTRGSSASPATITSSSLTTLVPQELLYGVCGGFTGGSDTTAPNSPFTRTGNTTWPQTSGYNLSTTVTGYTMSCAQASNAAQTWLIGLMGLRPAAQVVLPVTRFRSHMIL